MTTSSDNGERTVVLPFSGNPLAIAVQDVMDALELAPVWLRSGWLDVLFRFRRTRLGPFWHTLSLGAFVLTTGVLWSVILHQSLAHYLRYVTTGLIVWTFIASMVTDATGVLIAGQSTALSMRFPYAAFGFAHVWRGLLLFAHHFVLYVLIMLGTLQAPGWVALLSIPALLLLAANGVWMTLLIGMLCLWRRDLILAISSLMQIAMFVTPVFWPKDMLGPNLGFAADINPFYHLVLIARNPLLGEVPPLASWGAALAVLAVGSFGTLWLYGRNRNRFPYWY